MVTRKGPETLVAFRYIPNYGLPETYVNFKDDAKLAEYLSGEQPYKFPTPKLGVGAQFTRACYHDSKMAISVI